MVKNHLHPKPSVIAERYKFRQRKQSPGESIADYVVNLKKLAGTCDFGTNLDENLRDQLVFGLKSEVIIQRFFTEEAETLQFTKAYKIAISIEAAERDAMLVEAREGNSLELHRWDSRSTFKKCRNQLESPGTMVSSQDIGLQDKIIIGKEYPYSFEDGGVGMTLFSRMKAAGNVTAQIDGYTGEKQSYQALLQLCIRTALRMKKQGVLEGDIIVICSYNHLDAIVPLIAAFFIGAIPACLHPRFPASELMSQLQPKIAFVGPEALELIENSLEETGVLCKIILFGKSEKYLQFSEILNFSEEEKCFVPIFANLQDTAFVSFSSGTTGAPKIICIPHRALLCQAKRFDLKSMLTVGSMYWNSTILFITACILNGNARIVVSDFDPDIIWDVLSTNKVAALFLTTYQAILMNKQKVTKTIDLELKVLIISGSHVNQCLKKDMQQLLPGVHISIGYGLTEICGPCVGFDPKFLEERELASKKPASIGRVLPGFSLKVVDLDTEQPLGPYQEGELRIKSRIQMNGYYNADSSNEWDSNGWLKTGDVVYYDEEYCFYVSDRMKEIIKVREMKVFPSSIEEILLANPHVEAAVVIGKPDPKDRHKLVAVIVLKKHAQGTVTEKEIQDFVDVRVEKDKQLHGGLIMVSAIPTTPTGKANRQIIKNMVVDGSIYDL